MDLSFLQKMRTEISERVASFNPCSYGSFVLTGRTGEPCIALTVGFNPCSYGSFVLTYELLEEE